MVVDVDSVRNRLILLKERKETESSSFWTCDSPLPLRVRSLSKSLTSSTMITTTTSQIMAHAKNENFFNPFRTLFVEIIREGVGIQDGEKDTLMGGNNVTSSTTTTTTTTTTQLFADLFHLGWLEPKTRTGLLWRTWEEALSTAIQQRVVDMADEEEEEDAEEDEMNDNDTSNDTTTRFADLTKWTQTVLVPWIHQSLHAGIAQNNTLQSPSANTKEEDLAYWSARLRHTCAETFGRTRMAHMFDMVADYPDSLPAVRDLQAVLWQASSSPSSLQADLANALQTALHRRLCHPGATTHQIIQVYVNAIKVLRVIDPTDRLLTAVAEPVRQYLRGRSDTVRCIIASLISNNSDSDGNVNGNNTDLYEELRRQDARPLEEVTTGGHDRMADDEDDNRPPTLAWMPPPSIHQPRGSFLQASRVNTTGSGAEGDILAMLVSIYGSKELFVNEYRLMLADKLLSAKLDYHVDQEVHTLELLKLRFGERSMRSCEVMLKDVNDSKRTNANIRSFLDPEGDGSAAATTTSTTANPADTIVDAVMVSHIFWPTLHAEPMKHHPRLQFMLDVFGKEYARLKNPRILLWFHQLGTVEVEAEVVDQQESADGQKKSIIKTFTCSPVLATLLAHFEDKPEWTATELSNETSLSEHVIQKRMAYWVSQKVVRLVSPTTSPSHGGIGNGTNKPTYVLASVDYLASNEGDADSHALHHAHDNEEAGVSVAAQEEEEMDVYLSYIVGMLTNLGSLPLKTIHNNLKTFVTGSDIRYNKTPNQLGAFLQRLCKEERLEVGPDGMYKLFKK